MLRVEIGVEHVLHPLGFLDHGDEHGLGAHGPGVGHVEAEPEHALDPVALLLPFGVVLLQALPVDAVLGDGHPGLGLFPGLGGGDGEVQEFRGGVLLFELLHGHAPLAGDDAVVLGLLQHLFLVAGGDVHGDGGDFIGVEIVPPVHAFGHALPLPAGDGARPGAVEDGDTVGLFVLEHPGKAFFAGHGRPPFFGWEVWVLCQDVSPPPAGRARKTCCRYRALKTPGWRRGPPCGRIPPGAGSRRARSRSEAAWPRR